MVLENVKALYRRGRAHMKVWDFEEARTDLAKVSTLDPQLKPTCTKLVTEMSNLKKQDEKNSMVKLKGKLF